MDISVDKIIGANEIFVDTQKICDKLSEHSELIVFDNNKPQFVILSLTKYEKLKNMSVVSGQNDNTEIKIGKLVQDSMFKLINKDLLPLEEIKRLCTLNYSNSKFGLNFPMLKEFDPNPNRPIDMQKRDKNGYNRYYKFLLNIHGKQYLLCSQWIEELHRKKYLDWLSKWI
ncbi:MAG: hypothetical protein NC452_17405 [Eubacterium sp.]|nr:hypothetical protein [Eubacterium sp.]